MSSVETLNRLNLNEYSVLDQKIDPESRFEAITFKDNVDGSLPLDSIPFFSKLPRQHRFVN